MLINLKERNSPFPDGQPRSSAGSCGRRRPSMHLALHAAAQDLTIDSTVSRTQYQFVLESPNPKDFDTWVRGWWNACRRSPSPKWRLRIEHALSLSGPSREVAEEPPVACVMSEGLLSAPQCSRAWVMR